jgi:hypothetical protein
VSRRWEIVAGLVLVWVAIEGMDAASCATE